MLDKALQKIERENYEGALADLTSHLETDSLNAFAYYKRGFAHAMLMRHQNALDDFNRAISLQPGNAQFYSERGIAKLNLKDKDGACLDWEKAGEMKFEPARDLFNEYCNQ